MNYFMETISLKSQITRMEYENNRLMIQYNKLQKQNQDRLRRSQKMSEVQSLEENLQENEKDKKKAEVIFF